MPYGPCLGAGKIVGGYVKPYHHLFNVVTLRHERDSIGRWRVITYNSLHRERENAARELRQIYRQLGRRVAKELPKAA